MKAIRFSLTEALLQIQSSIFSLGNMALQDFAAEDQGGGDAGSEEVFFLMYNSFNELLLAMRRSSDLYVGELVDRRNQKDEISMIIFVLSIVFLCLMVAILVPVVASVNEHKSKVMMLFCEIEDSAIRKLSFKCDRFLMKLQSEENADDMDSNNDEMLLMIGDSGAFRATGQEEDDDYTSSSSSGQGSGVERKKRAKNLMKTSLLFYLKFVAGFMVIEAYFAFNFSAIRNYAGDTRVLVSELNTTTAIEPFLWFTLNAQRELYYNASKPIKGASTSFLVGIQNIYLLSQVIYKLESDHIYNEGYLSETYRDAFTMVMRDDNCPQQSYYPEFPPGSDSYPACEAFSSGLATQGLNVMLINFIKYTRRTLSQYQDTLAAASGVNLTALKVTMMNSPDIIDTYILQRYFVEPQMRRLVSSLNSSIIDGLNSLIQRTLFLLIFFLILLLLAYVAVWIPLVNQLNTQINKTKLMLMIVPIELLMKMKNIGKVLQS
jgi:cytochrome c biogenesis protein CcdA